MGQYYIAVNIDRKEYIEPNNIGISHKAFELALNNFGSVLLYLQMTRSSHTGSDFEPTGQEGRWEGDRVLTLGDSSEYYRMTLKLFDEISFEVAEGFNEAVDDQDRLKIKKREEKRDMSRGVSDLSKTEAEELLDGIK
jgi:hypothetical protein